MLERGRDVKHPDYPTAMTESWQFAGRNRLSRADLAEAGKAEPHRLHHASGLGALVRQRRRESVLRSPALRLDARLPRRRPLAALGPAVVPLERARLRGERARRRRRGLADPLRGHLARGTTTSSGSRGSAAAARGCRNCPTASSCRRWQMNCLEMQVKERIAKAFGGRPMIIGRVANLTQPHNGRGGCQYPEPLHPRLPVRRLLQQQRGHAAGRLRHRPADAAAVLDRDGAHLRSEDQAGHRRAHRRRGDEPDDGVLRARDLSLRVGDCLDVHPPQLDLGSLPERARQRQRRARPQPDGPPLQGRGQRRVRRFRRPLLQGTAAERHLHPAVPEPRRQVAAEGLPPRVRLSGQREPRELGARHQGAEPLRRRPQGGPHCARTVALRHRLVGRVPAVPREPHVP